MKKIIALILIMVMLISDVSCGGPNVTEDPQPKANGWLVEVGAPTDTFGLAEGQMCLDQFMEM